LLLIDIQPLTPDRWADLERLFGPRGAFGGCWCMFNRLTGREFEAGQGEGNRTGLRALVDGGRIPGLLAYQEGEPVGWVSVAPRSEFGRIERSPVTRPIDDQPAWSVVCFYIDRHHRHSGVGTALLEAAVDHAAAHGARLVEGYPKDPRRDQIPDIYAWQGIASMFRAAGFDEVARRKEGRPIMRKKVGT
jgi:GNAT superfamily N-acetyltransferase